MITAASFPTPHLALRSVDPDEDSRVRRFALEQATAAEAVRLRITEGLRHATRRADRVDVLMAAHDDLIHWRHELALRTGRRLGRGLAHDASRFVTTLRDAGPNYDRIGYLGRLRDGSVWDPATRTFRGGTDTPAHRIMLAYGEIATARFADCGAGDVLRNRVVLPDGSEITGNSLVRAAAARRVACELVERIARRGGDTSQIETGDDPIYVRTAADSDREVMFRVALDVLGGATYGDVKAWQAARYLLYQAPLTKKGSDAVTRTFLVAVGAVIFGFPPVLDHDVDLRCIVCGQESASVLPSDQTK